MLYVGKGANAIQVMTAIARSQAVVEFDMSGHILDANDSFCRTLGYELGELRGRHHSLFWDADLVRSTGYREFWDRLRSGAFESGCYKLLAKDGHEIWIQASYNPVFKRGKPVKVIKLASDISRHHEQAIDDAGKLEALSRSQAVIEFTPAGKIITANENFCRALGYSLPEIVGRHHRIFCHEAYARSTEYRAFWTRLGSGEFIADEFVRVDKNGSDVWIQAAYNPILDAKGNVRKVVKFATDVTPRMAAISSVADAIEAVSNGDLTQSLDGKFVPSMEGLRTSFNRAISKLRETMLGIEGSTTGISHQATEMNDAAATLSKRTETQAASLAETGAALELISATVRDTSLRAGKAGLAVKETRDVAAASGHVVHEAVAAMGEIEKSSQAITSIIGVIDDIAFQTNLLARMQVSRRLGPEKRVRDLPLLLRKSGNLHRNLLMPRGKSRR